MRSQYADMVRRFVKKRSVQPLPAAPVDRQRLVGAVAGALRARARNRSIINWSAAVGSIAVAAALILGPRIALVSKPAQMTKLDNGRPDDARAPGRLRAFTVLRTTGESGASASAPLAAGTTLETGAELIAPAAGQILVGTGEGTALTLEAGSRMRVGEAGATQRLDLRHGAVRARVAKLHAGERFLVTTADAEIEVHGTAFRVAVGDEPTCAGGSVTRVSVSEGVVTVRSNGRESLLFPGDEWARACTSAAALEPAAAADRDAAAAAKHRAARPSRARSAGTVAARQTGDGPRSALDVQNDLFEAAVRAKREGRPAEAIKLFERLSRSYPEGPLVESALAQRMKVLAEMDKRAAAAAAADYLARFPGGFARADARALLGSERNP